jgi:hypothetical protein
MEKKSALAIRHGHNRPGHSPERHHPEKTKTNFIFRSLLMVLLVALMLPANAQEDQSGLITPHGIFDTVADRFGKKYALKDLRIPGSPGYKSSQPPPMMSICGYFTAYFESGSGMDGNSLVEIDRRAVVCQVLTDLSTFLGYTGGAPFVNIQVADITPYAGNPQTSGILGVASAFYCYPVTPASPNPGMLYNTVQKTILSKVDAYMNVVNSPINTTPGNSAGFYHGFMAFNFQNPIFNWYLNYSAGLAGPADLDLYTVVLHEMTHQLGFASLIQPGGGSAVGGAGYNYYSKYDTYLTNNAGTSPLILSSGQCSQQYGLQFNVNASVLAPNCVPNYPPNTTNCNTSVMYNSPTHGLINVYTPDCWEGGSSLSHYEDMCHPTANPANNDQIYTMSNANGFGVNKRYLQEVERSVLCDMGYDVDDQYYSPAVGVVPFYQYMGSPCTSYNIWGVNDGLTGTGFQYMTTQNVALTIPISGITGNDSPNTNAITCVESVYSNGVATQVGTNIIFTPANGYIGMGLIRYIPVDASGKEGNITYIYVYVQVGQCNTHCDLVQNGGFENNQSCGVLYGPWNGPHRTIDCWMTHNMTPDFYVRSCNAPMGTVLSQLGVNTNNSTPVFDSHSGSGTGNDAVVGLTGYFCFNASQAYGEEMFTKLATPLVPGKTYRLSFWAYQYSGSRQDPALGAAMQSENASQTPVMLKFRSSALPSVYNTGVQVTPAPTFNTLLNPNLGTVFNTWKQYVYTFLYNPGSNNHNYLYVAIDMAGTAQNYVNANGQAGGCLRFQALIDDISVQELLVGPTLSTCFGNALNNLGQYASVGGVFSGVGVTSSGGQYHFNAQGTLPVGSYQVNFTSNSGPGGCAMVQPLTINVTGAPVITLDPNSVLCSSNGPPNLMVNVTPPGSNITWSPGGGMGPVLPLPPNTTGWYTATATYNGCSSQLAIEVKLHCCNSLTRYEYSTITGGSYLTGPMYFDQDVTITGGPPNSTTYMWGGEFIFAPNVKITVPSGQSLNISEAHFFSCSDMWKGIDVQDGGKVKVHYSLMEDAFSLISLNGATSTAPMWPVEITQTIFNKNEVSISVGNSALTYLPLRIVESVFTCRAIQYTPMTWPNVFALNNIINPPTGLASPYSLGGFNLTNLTAPLSTLHSRAGIYISDFDNVGGNSPSTGVEFGSNIVPNEFNLFDGMQYGIEVLNGNLRTMNNCFTDMYPNIFQGGPVGGTGIRHTVNSDMNASLDIAPWGQPNTTFGNRFWNCITGVDATNVYRINSSFAVFRSVQSKLNQNGILPGNMGMRISTNRFNYDIIENDFNNVREAIDITITSGSYNSGSGQQTGTYANNMNVKTNYIDAHVSGSNVLTNEYVHKGINLLNTASGAWTGVASTGIYIHSNNVNRAYRGISVNAVQNYPTEVSGNKVLLLDDLNPSNFQYGIQLLNTVNSIRANYNTLQGVSPGNQQMTLVYCDNNSSTSGQSPQILCNTLSNSYIGFDFNASNSSTSWKGNTMNNHGAGLCLSNNGIMGPQVGGPLTSGNRWLWSGSGLHTLVRGGSDAQFSKLYVQNSSLPFYPNSHGGPGAQNYGATGNINVPFNAIKFSCGTNPLPPPPVHKLSNSGAASIEEHVEEQLPVEIYPNPAQDKFVVSGVPEYLKFDIVMYDACGKVLFADQSRDASNAEMHVDLANGIYFVKVTTSQGTTVVRKVVITD